MTGATDPVAAFAAEVGPPDAGPVVAVGGRTQWDVGGPVDAGAGAREVRPPAGVVAVEAADMTVRVRAGTTVADLDAALAEVGQCVALPSWPGATVGGVLAVGRSGLRRNVRCPRRHADSSAGSWVKRRHDDNVVPRRPGGMPTAISACAFSLPFFVPCRRLRRLERCGAGLPAG